MPHVSHERSGAHSALHHRIAAHARVYDLIQRVVGGSVVLRHVELWLRLAPGAYVLDVGGGTGGLKRLVGAGVRHVCLDLERAKLVGYASKFEDARPVQADAAALPVRPGAVQAVTLALVAHHLTDGDLHTTLREIARVLAPDGVLILYDAVWAPARLAGRLLWKYDRGSHPRTVEQLAAALGHDFDVVERPEFAVFHRYVAFRCRPRRPRSTGVER